MSWRSSTEKALGRCGECHLQTTQAEQPHPHGPEGFGVQLHPHQEQHHHHAELGKVLKRGGLLANETDHRPNDHTSHQVTQY